MYLFISICNSPFRSASLHICLPTHFSKRETLYLPHFIPLLNSFNLQIHILNQDIPILSLTVQQCKYSCSQHPFFISQHDSKRLFSLTLGLFRMLLQLTLTMWHVVFILTIRYTGKCQRNQARSVITNHKLHVRLQR